MAWAGWGREEGGEEGGVCAADRFDSFCTIRQYAAAAGFRFHGAPFVRTRGQAAPLLADLWKALDVPGMPLICLKNCYLLAADSSPEYPVESLSLSWLVVVPQQPCCVHRHSSRSAMRTHKIISRRRVAITRNPYRALCPVLLESH